MEGFPLDSDHWVDNARIADITCVLFHYKFLEGHFHEQAARAVQEESYWNNSADYKKYLQVLDENPTLQVKQETAREIKSVDDLVEDGFLVVSEEYMMMVYDEQRKGGGQALGGEQSGPEDEAAIYRARAQAKVQSLRAQRLERHLEGLKEQNRREVERLRSALARVRKKNRSLTHQLRSMRASRSLRLLDKLARLRAKMLGRG
jgi:flagellar biosynthesis chaperone FliJ